MANAIAGKTNANRDPIPGTPEAPELMRDSHQTKGKSELTTGEEVEGEHEEVVERAVDATRDSSQRKEAIERAIHPDSNRDGN